MQQGRLFPSSLVCGLVILFVIFRAGERSSISSVRILELILEGCSPTLLGHPSAAKRALKIRQDDPLTMSIRQYTICSACLAASICILTVTWYSTTESWRAVALCEMWLWVSRFDRTVNTSRGEVVPAQSLLRYNLVWNPIKFKFSSRKGTSTWYPGEWHDQETCHLILANSRTPSSLDSVIKSIAYRSQPDSEWCLLNIQPGTLLLQSVIEFIMTRRVFKGRQLSGNNNVYSNGLF